MLRENLCLHGGRMQWLHGCQSHTLFDAKAKQEKKSPRDKVHKTLQNGWFLFFLVDVLNFEEMDDGAKKITSERETCRAGRGSDCESHWYHSWPTQKLAFEEWVWFWWFPTPHAPSDSEGLDIWDPISWSWSFYSSSPEDCGWTSIFRLHFSCLLFFVETLPRQDGWSRHYGSDCWCHGQRDSASRPSLLQYFPFFESRVFFFSVQLSRSFSTTQWLKGLKWKG